MTDQGTFLQYEELRFTDAQRKDIAAINHLTEEYEAKGYRLSVRQIHYQFVGRGWLPNTTKTYTYLQKLISRGRLAGLISWTAIEDRERSLMGLKTEKSPHAALNALRSSYRLDLWRDQTFRPEVWGEKKSTLGVMAKVCNELRVDYYACKGYNSTSMAWEAGQRFADYIRRGQRPIIFYIGDHDPSGLDMDRDIRERIAQFTGMPVMVQRLALARSQVDALNLPENPVKVKASGDWADSRASEYVREHGEKSWELDALEPDFIHTLIKNAIDQIREADKFDAMLQREVDDKLLLDEMIEMIGEAPKG